jgi:two-component system, LuxR family, response regulator DctR
MVSAILKAERTEPQVDAQRAAGHQPTPPPVSRPVVWIVDDDEAITALVTRIVESLELTPRAFNRSTDFIAAFDPDTYGCLITDVSMPGVTGLELLQHLVEQRQLPPTILITGHGSIPMCVEAMRLGAFDFLQKPFSPSQLKELIGRAIEADRDRRATTQNITDVEARLANLTEEEQATLRLMLEGSMNKHIAAALDVSRRTVQYRIASLLEKMGVRSRGQLISMVTAARLARDKSAPATRRT